MPALTRAPGTAARPARTQPPRRQGRRPTVPRPVLRAASATTPPPDVAAPSVPTAPTTSSSSSSSSDPAFAGGDARPIMLYDGVCGLCNAGVDAALALDRGRCLRFAALQSPAGRRLLAAAGRAPDDISSVVLVTADGRAFIESAAIVEIGRVLGVPGPLAAAALALPARGRDRAYRAVADNRYALFGKRDACRLTQDGEGGGGGGRGGDAGDPGRFLVE
jgi:predicted DCC family thiol-disulfide oxidoreductase YuxK